MNNPITEQDVVYAENLLASGDFASATSVLERMVEDVENYSAVACEPNEDVQYFSFSDAFERLAYRRVERDPRRLVQVDAPFDRLYAAMAYAYIRQEDYVSARNALTQAVRWNPMNCAYRLDLAELFHVLGNTQEWAALSHSVLERASDARSAARAYANLGQFFLEAENDRAAAACAHLASKLAAQDARVEALLEIMDAEHSEAMHEDEKKLMTELASQGVETAPSAEVAICLLMCALDAMEAGDKTAAARLTVRARGLIGEDACAALMKLIRESDAELAGGASSASVPDASVEGDADAQS